MCRKNSYGGDKWKRSPNRRAILFVLRTQIDDDTGDFRFRRAIIKLLRNNDAGPLKI